MIERHALARNIDPKIALKAAGFDTPNIPMGGNVFPVGIYWLEVGVGSPTKYYGVAIDSGYVLICPSLLGVALVDLKMSLECSFVLTDFF